MKNLATPLAGKKFLWPLTTYLTFRRDARTTVKYNAAQTEDGNARNTCGVEVVRYKMKTYDLVVILLAPLDIFILSKKVVHIG